MCYGIPDSPERPAGKAPTGPRPGVRKPSSQAPTDSWEYRILHENAAPLPWYEFEMFCWGCKSLARGTLDGTMRYTLLPAVCSCGRYVFVCVAGQWWEVG